MKRFRPSSLARAVAIAGMVIHASYADDVVKQPDRRELWVPVADLNTVLEDTPRAVLLTREQYEALLRDAKKNLPSTPEPPQRAVLASARYTGTLSGDVVDVQAEFTVNVLSEKWAEVPLRLAALSLGDIKLDGDAVVAGSREGARLIIRGRGEHRITAEFMLPVRKDSGVSSLQLSLPQAAAGLFKLSLPADTQVESSSAVDVKKTTATTTVGVALSSQNDAVLTWRSTGSSQQGAAILFQESSYIYSIDETRIQADLGIVLNAALGSLPASVQIAIPKGATPLQVLGGEVLKWTANGEMLTVDLTPGDRRTTALRVLLEMPSLGQQARDTLPLPLPVVTGVRRAAGKFAVIGSKGVKVKEITAAPGTVQGEGLFDNSIEQDARFVSAWGFAVQPASIKVVVEKIKPQFSADLDTLAEFKREDISVGRTLALNGEEGEIFETSFVMPGGEELLSVRNEDDSEPDWKADGDTIKIRWSDGLGAGQKRVFKIKSRMEPAKWPETDQVSLGDLKIPGAEKINGYIALKADEMFRLETSVAKDLEQRDGRTTPVEGDFAWFRRETFQLQVKVARREAEVQSTLLGYALPMDGALDVHGQLNFNILHSGVRKLRIKVPAESAEQFYFDGAQIAERNRDGDTWTVFLQKETSGNYTLKFHAVIPFDETKANFHVDIPDVSPLDVRQQSGTWAVEANTATEISFKTSGMNELDPLHAPTLADYQPKHHVIGVFGYLGQQHSLKLEGVKHEAAPILTTLADKLDLATVVSTSGAERHQAAFYIRTVGDQFLDVTLPEGSNIWSLTVDNQPMKPVAERPNVVRVQLSATLDRTHPTKVQLLYETRRHEWGASGGYNLVAPRLDARIPVLQSSWRIWLPDGFSYTAFDSNLRATETPQVMPLLFIASRWWKGTSLPGGAPAYTALVVPRSESAAGPVPAFEGLPQRDRNTVQIDMAATNVRNTKYIQDKLNHIIIPKIEFREATVREAIDFLKQKSRDCDTTEPDPARRGVSIVLKLESTLDTANNAPPVISPSEARITLSLTNIPLGEALRYVANLSGLKVKIDPYAVTIAPLSEPTDTLITKEYNIPPSFLNQSPNAIGASSSRMSTQDYFERSGVQFPPGAVATYLASSDKLIIRNTEANLDLVDQIVGTLGVHEPNAPSPGTAQISDGMLSISGLVTGSAGIDFKAKKASGLLPMKIDLDRAGREFSFDGLYAAENVKFHYVDWWSEARRGWIWWVAGGIAFFALGRSPWRKLVWGILALTFFPLCVAQSLTGMCNALLAGWLAGFLIHQISTRLVFRTRVVEAGTV